MFDVFDLDIELYNAKDDLNVINNLLHNLNHQPLNYLKRGLKAFYIKKKILIENKIEYLSDIKLNVKF